MSYNPNPPGYPPPEPAFGGYGAGPYAAVPVEHAPPAVRAAFLNKMYLALAGGVALSMATGFWAMGFAPLMNLVLGGGLMGFGLMFVVLMGMSWAMSSVVTKPGINYVAFAAYTMVLGAVLLAPMFLIAARQTGNVNIVWNAFGLTALVFAGLSGFVVVTGKDFSFMGGFLFVGFLLLLGFSVATFFFAAPAFHMLVTCFGLLLFAGFILYDTSVIMKAMTPDMWMAGAFSLFVDFITCSSA